MIDHREKQRSFEQLQVGERVCMRFKHSNEWFRIVIIKIPSKDVLILPNGKPEMVDSELEKQVKK